MKKILLFTLLILSVSSVIGQEIVRYSTFRNFDGFPELRRDGDNLFVNISVSPEDDPGVYDDVELDIEYAERQNGSTIQARIVLKYELGKGYVSGDYLNYSGALRGYDGESDTIAISTFGYALTLNDSLLFGYIEPGNVIGDSLDLQYTMMIYNQQTDSILSFEELDVFGGHNYCGFDYLKLDGDYLYVETSFVDSVLFLGQKFYRQIPFFVGKETLIHKVNWKTNEIMWSHQIGSRFLADKIDEVGVDDEGNVTVGIFIDGQSYLDGEELIDSSGAAYLGLLFYKFTSEGEFIDVQHVDFFGPMIKSFRLEKDGSISIWGFGNPDFPLMVGSDTIFSPELNLPCPLYLKLDKDLNYDFHKTYYCNANSYITSATGAHGEGDYLSSTFRDTLVLDDQVLVKKFNEPFDRDSQLMFKIDDEGNVVGLPYIFKDFLTVLDIYEVEEDYFVIAIEGTTRGYEFLEGSIDFLLGPGAGSTLDIWEVKGNLFSVMTSLNDYYNAVDYFAIYPNPVGAILAVRDLPPTFESERTTVSIYDFSGRLELSLVRSSLDLASDIDVSTLAPGPKIITLTNGAHVIRSRFVKR